MPQSPLGFSYTDRDVDRMTEAMLGEARNEGMDAMTGVGNTVVNRVLAGGYAPTISSVVTQRGAGRTHQFSYIDDHNYADARREIEANTKLAQQARDQAVAILQGQVADNTDGATGYHGRGAHIGSYQRRGLAHGVVQIGSQEFYTPERDAAAVKARIADARSTTTLDSIMHSLGTPIDAAIGVGNVFKSAMDTLGNKLFGVSPDTPPDQVPLSGDVYSMAERDVAPRDVPSLRDAALLGQPITSDQWNASIIGKATHPYDVGAHSWERVGEQVPDIPSLTSMMTGGQDYAPLGSAQETISATAPLSAAGYQGPGVRGFTPALRSAQESISATPTVTESGASVFDPSTYGGPATTSETGASVFDPSTYGPGPTQQPFGAPPTQAKPYSEPAQTPKLERSLSSQIADAMVGPAPGTVGVGKPGELGTPVPEEQAPLSAPVAAAPAPRASTVPAQRQRSSVPADFGTVYDDQGRIAGTVDAEGKTHKTDLTSPNLAGSPVFDDQGNKVGTIQDGKVVADPTGWDRTKSAAWGAAKGLVFGGIPGALAGALGPALGLNTAEGVNRLFGGPQPQMNAPPTTAADVIGPTGRPGYTGPIDNGVLGRANQLGLGAAPQGYHYGWSPVLGVASVANTAPENIQIAGSGSGILGALGLADKTGYHGPTSLSGIAGSAASSLGGKIKSALSEAFGINGVDTGSQGGWNNISQGYSDADRAFANAAASMFGYDDGGYGRGGAAGNMGGGYRTSGEGSNLHG